MSANSHTHKGFVSIFVVIFSAILISIITISFVRLMINDQQQATSNDLSRSAYDSALAGAEDAKRALINCNSGDASACLKINSLNCNEAVGVASDVETPIKTGDNDSLNQAYTCVKVQMNTDNYLGSLSQDGYKMIPLSAAGTFDTIQLEWFSANNTTSTAVNLINAATPPSLFEPSVSNSPPVMRAQFIQLGTKVGFSLTDLDGGASAGSQTGASALFLYPSKTGLIPTVSTSFPIVRMTPQTSPKAVVCQDIASAVYSCSVKIKLPLPIISTDQSAFLILSAFYNNADYKVTLFDSMSTSPTKAIQFNGVQPEIDSTGRANDLFRRVKTRVELTDANFPYPEAAVDITGNLCKTFSVTDNSDEYVPGGCTD